MQLADAAMPTSPPSACCPHLQRRQCCELMAGFLHLQDCPHAIGVACFVATAVCFSAASLPSPLQALLQLLLSLARLPLPLHQTCQRWQRHGKGSGRGCGSGGSTDSSAALQRRQPQQCGGMFGSWGRALAYASLLNPRCWDGGSRR